MMSCVCPLHFRERVVVMMSCVCVSELSSTYRRLWAPLRRDECDRARCRRRNQENIWTALDAYILCFDTRSTLSVLWSSLPCVCEFRDEWDESIWMSRVKNLWIDICLEKNGFASIHLYIYTSSRFQWNEFFCEREKRERERKKTYRERERENSATEKRNESHTTTTT